MLSTIIFLIVTSTLLTWIFSIVFKNPGPWNSFWVLVAVLFLMMFGFVLWVSPIGPVWYEVAWMDAILFGLILTLLIGSTSGSQENNFPTNEKGEVDLVAAAKRESGTMKIFSLFFWIFILVLVLIIASGLFHRLSIS
jgi:hypothetical protein